MCVFLVGEMRKQHSQRKLSRSKLRSYLVSIYLHSHSDDLVTWIWLHWLELVNIFQVTTTRQITFSWGCRKENRKYNGDLSSSSSYLYPSQFSSLNKTNAQNYAFYQKPISIYFRQSLDFSWYKEIFKNKLMIDHFSQEPLISLI